MKTTVSKVCVGGAKIVNHGNAEINTGIFKTAQSASVAISEAGLLGDVQVDLRFHGGKDKAVYVYPDSHYDYWRNELGLTQLEDAQFGENINVSGIDDSAVVIGDRFQLGSAIVEVTQPRIPCFKLGIRLQDDSFPAKFLLAGKLGFYLRVEKPGEVEQGDGFELLSRGNSGITVADLWRVTFTNTDESELAQRALDELAYLDEGWRKRLASRVHND
ncbi:MAG: MOSC domain-containing protein [Pseudohongiellaceae bacterium]